MDALGCVLANCYAPLEPPAADFELQTAKKMRGFQWVVQGNGVMNVCVLK